MEWGNKLNTKKKILVVDDKGMNRYMLGGIFRDNYEIIEAGGGMEAIAIIDKEYDELAVILLDIIGVLEHMKEQDYLNRVPVVIVTDDSSEATAVKAFEYKVADMVIKPFEPRIIKRRVENIIELYAYKEKYGNA